MEKETSAEIQVVTIVTEISKLNLQSGDVLSVTLKGDDLSPSDLQSLQEGIKQTFPDNKVMMFMMRNDQAIKFEVIKGESNESES